MSEELQISFAQGSDVGRVRDHNEDCVVAEIPADLELRRKGRLFIVADGMGGYQAGEVASRIATEAVRQAYYADPSDDPTERLSRAVEKANIQVHHSAQGDTARTGMGTTIVATALVGHVAYIASVGDSRAYWMHQDQMSQVTQDHSFVGEQIRAGLLTKEQARMHPQRNVITRALGSQPTVQVDTFVRELSDGDVLVMCSDGLTAHVPDDRIGEAVRRLLPNEAVQRLIQMARDDGGTDNISAIVLRVEPASTQDATVPAAARPLISSDPQDTPPAGSLSADALATAAAAKTSRVSLGWVIFGAVVVLVAVGILSLFALAALGLLDGSGRVKPTAVPSLLPSPTTAAVEATPPAVTTVPLQLSNTDKPPGGVQDPAARSTPQSSESSRPTPSSTPSR